MRLGDDFKVGLRRELERRLADGTLPEPMRKVLGSAGLVLKQPGHAGALFAAAAPEAEVRIQTVVNAFESPSLLIREHSFAAPASETWATVLEPRRSVLEAMIPAVGRIEVENHPSRRWIGTGLLVAPTVVVTNRHVALQMAAESADGWRFAPGSGGQMITATMDFLEEHGLAASAEFSLDDILAVENAGGPDLAFLRIEAHEDLPEHAALGGTLVPEEAVAAIGYTSKETDMPPEVEEILTGIFGAVYDVKRLAPGRVLAVAGERISHDCSTQGGNSGSALVEIESALVAGIHFEGGVTENYAVPADVVRARLDSVG